MCIHFEERALHEELQDGVLKGFVQSAMRVECALAVTCTALRVTFGDIK